METYEILTSIAAGEQDEKISRIFDALKERRKAIKAKQEAIAKATLSIGDKGTLTGLRPKYINGAHVIVTGINRTRIEVKVDEDKFTSSRARDRLGWGSTVPMTCFVPAAEE